MSAGLSAAERQELGLLLDVLVPAAEGMPSASEAGVNGAMLDVVLNLRPDLREPLLRVMREARGADPESYPRALAECDPETFRAIGTVAAHGYYMSVPVRDLIGYKGQQRNPIDPDEVPDYLRDGTMQRVLDRGPIWRDPDATEPEVSQP